MKARFLKTKKIGEMLDNIGENLDTYRHGKFDTLETDPSVYFEGKFTINTEILSEIDVNETDQQETVNCKLIFNAITGISPYLARDERFWVYLTHTLLLDYSRKRWPIPEDNEKAVKHIKRHFFASNKRGIERDNAASRLWWMAYLCSRVEALPFDSALECFLYQSDVRANIIDRPTTSQSIKVFSAIVSKLHESFQGDKTLFIRNNFRNFMKQLNLSGGVKLLDVLEEDEINSIISECV